MKPNIRLVVQSRLEPNIRLVVQSRVKPNIRLVVQSRVEQNIWLAVQSRVEQNIRFFVQSRVDPKGLLSSGKFLVKKKHINLKGVGFSFFLRVNQWLSFKRVNGI